MMKSLIVLSLLMAFISAYAESGPEADKTIWFQCTKDTDCTIAAGACGPDAVNKKYKNEFETHAKKIMPYVDCMPLDKRKRQAVCSKKICTLK